MGRLLEIPSLRALRHPAYARLIVGALVSNIGTGKPYSVFQLIAAAQKVTGREAPYDLSARRQGDPPQLSADARHFQALFGEATLARSTLEQIIESAWRWHLSLQQRDPALIVGTRD